MRDDALRAARLMRSTVRLGSTTTTSLFGWLYFLADVDIYADLL
jgi:hypothetical protein